jgi:hypothetical protein
MIDSPLLGAMPWFDWLLLIGATLRLTRFLIVDDLGVRLYREPIEEGLVSRLPARWHWLIDGLSCPFCVGFWIGAALLALSLAATDGPTALHLGWEVILAALTLNYLAAHIGARLDPHYDGDDTPEPTEGDR